MIKINNFQNPICVIIALQSCNLSLEEVRPMVSWLANLDAKYLNVTTSGLWDVGTYWDMDKRGHEFKSMTPTSELDQKITEYGDEFDRILSNCRFQTVIHGDAKVENFCFGPSGVAGIDFQWVVHIRA